MKPNMIFAIDYDDTYTAWPTMWDQFMAGLILNGHDVYIVTARRDTEENRKKLSEGITAKFIDEKQIVFCDLHPKYEVMQKRGIDVSIWIDDNPGSIVHGM